MGGSEDHEITRELPEEVTERVRLSPTKDEDLGNVVHKLILPYSEESEEKTSKLDTSAKKMEPGSCLDLMCGSGEHSCDGRSWVRIQSFLKEGLATWYGDITEKEKSEVQIVAECYSNATVNVAAALGFFSRMCSLQSLEMLESEHHLVTALSVESWPGALQITQQHIRGWKIGLEAEMGFPVSGAFNLPVNAKYRWWPTCREPLSLTHGNGGGIQSEDTNRQILLVTQVRTTGSNVASFT